MNAGVGTAFTRDALVATTAHPAHRERLGPTGVSSANRRPDGCKHGSSHDSPDPSAAAAGVNRSRPTRRRRMLSPFSERASHECVGVAANARSAPVAAEADDRVRRRIRPASHEPGLLCDVRARLRLVAGAQFFIRWRRGVVALPRLVLKPRVAYEFRVALRAGRALAPCTILDDGIPPGVENSLAASRAAEV